MQISIIDFAKNAPSIYATKRDGRPIPVWLRGRPGQAKSSIVERGVRAYLAKHFELPIEKVDVITDMPAQRDAPDYRGYLVPTKVSGGNPISVYTKPDLMTRVENSPAIDGGIVILFLDEIMQADHLTQKVLTDLILNGRLGEFQLPPNVWIICASNYQEDGAGVNRALTILTNRMTVLDVHLPFEAWKKYAEKQGLHRVLIDFAEFQKHEVFADAVPRKDGPFPTPRSFTDAARYINTRIAEQGITDPHAIPQDEFTKAVVAGFIGDAEKGLAAQLFAYADDYAVLPKFADILKDPMKAKVPPLEKLSAQYAAAQMIKHHVTAQNTDKVWQYAARLMKDMQVSTANDILNNTFGGVLFNAPVFQKWMGENKALIGATFQ